MATVFVITLVAQTILFCFTAISWQVPAHRVWPPPSPSGGGRDPKVAS